MRAVVLVGGFGTRLRPLTFTTPKPLLPVGHVPIVELVVGSLARAGVTEAVLAIGFKPDVFRAAYPDGTCAGVPLVYAVEPEPLDTAGAIRFAACHAGLDQASEPFLVVNGDVITDFDVAALTARHAAAGAEGTIALTPVDDPSRTRFGWRNADTDRPRRLRLVADTYGLDADGRTELLACLDDSIARGGQFVLRRVEAGDPNFIAMWESFGGMARFDRRRAWWVDARPTFAAALELSR